MATNYDQLISQAQAQGQAQQADYTNKANTARSSYANYTNQANTANQDIKNFNAYMAGAGNASNLYGNALSSQEQQAGYNQQQMAQAMSNLSNATGSLSAYNDFANTAASKWGLNAGGFAAANAGAQSSLNNNISAASQSLKNQQNAFQLAQTGAQQQASLGVQQQQQQLTGYTQVYNNALEQQKQAQATMLSYEKMAQDQGGLTSQQIQAYANSKQLEASAQAQLASAQAAIAQSKLFLSQSAGQNITNQANQASLDYANQQRAAQQSQAAAQQEAQQRSNANQYGSFFDSGLGQNIAQGFNNVAKYGPLALFGAGNYR